MNAYAEYKNTGVPELTDAGWPVDQTRFWPYQTVTTADPLVTKAEADAVFSALTPAQKVAQTTTTRPAGNYQLRVDASGAGTGSAAVIGTSVIDLSVRPDLLDLRLNWVNGKAEVYNNASPQPAGGDQNFWWINGAAAATGTCPVRQYPPGTWLNYFFGQGPREELYPDGYLTKAQQYVYVGNPPA